MRKQEEEIARIYSFISSMANFFQIIETILKFQFLCNILLPFPSSGANVISHALPSLSRTLITSFYSRKSGGRDFHNEKSSALSPLCHRSVRFFRANEKARPQKTKRQRERERERRRETSRAKLRVQSPLPADLASTIPSPSTKERWPILISLKRGGRSTY